MDDTLFRAILAMDSYNRGYGAGISNLVDTGLGTATILFDAEDSESFPQGEDDAAQDAGFYAIAYQLSDGSKVISYRGTPRHRAGDARIASGRVGGHGFSGLPARRGNPAGLKSALRDLRAGALKDKDVKVLVREASGAARVATLTELAAEASNAGAGRA